MRARTARMTCNTLAAAGPASRRDVLGGAEGPETDPNQPPVKVRHEPYAGSRAGATGRAVVLLISSIDSTEVTLKIETSLISAR